MTFQLRFHRMDRSRSHDAVIRVYDDAGNVIETHEKGTNLNKFRHQRKAKDNVVPLRFDQVVWSFTHLVRMRGREGGTDSSGAGVTEATRG